jgi:di/tricarboxylate transporter
MTPEILFVLVVTGLAGALFISGRVRLDIVAILVVLALALGGILSPSEALAGFGNPVVIMVAGLLVISDMLARTGVAQLLGRWLGRHGRGSEVRLIVLLSLVVGVLGCFMTNAAVVAIFLPVVLSLGNTTRLNASRLLLPLAYAGLVSGMLTLIATAPNLVVASELERAGFEPFSFFSFTPIGGAVLLVFVLYMILVGRHLLPGARVTPPTTAARNFDELLSEFDLLGTANRLHVPAGSPLVGRTLAASEIGSRYEARVILLERIGRLGREVLTTPAAETELRGGDVLVVGGPSEGRERLTHELGLRALPTTAGDRERWIREAGIAKVLVHPESSLIGRTLRGIALRSTYGVQVLAVRRGGAALDGFLDEELASGDALLVIGPWKRIRQLQSSLRDFVVLALPTEIEHVVPAWRRAPIAVTILAVMVTLSAFEIVPVVVAVLIAVLLAVGTRCLTMEQSYGAIQWSTIVLIAGMMSITRAMISTGAVDLVVDQLVAGIGGYGPHVMMTALFALTAASSAVLSNTATAVLLAPIAIRAASSFEIDPHAFAMTVAIAASAGFVVPMSSPAMMLVVGPGKYRLTDFVVVGFPMLVLTWIVTMLLVPILFPLV